MGVFEIDLVSPPGESAMDVSVSTDATSWRAHCEGPRASLAPCVPRCEEEEEEEDVEEFCEDEEEEEEE